MKSESPKQSAIYISLCLQSDGVISERIIDVSSCRLRCVECIAVIMRERETFFEAQWEIGLQRGLRNGSIECRKHDSRLQ